MIGNRVILIPALIGSIIGLCVQPSVTLSQDVAPTTAPSTRPHAAVPADVELRDVDRKVHAPMKSAAAQGVKGIVFFFVAIDCPISNAYAPEINRICRKYGRNSLDKADKAANGGMFDFYFVHSDPDVTPADAKKHASDFGYDCTVLMDPKKELSQDLGAKVTPEVFVVSTGGAILYHGRIDDRYVAYGKSRIEPTVRDLRQALDEIEAEKPVSRPETTAIGCPIE